MKRIFLLALATAFTVSSFAADRGKAKARKSRKAVKTDQVCSPNCPKTACSKM